MGEVRPQYCKNCKRITRTMNKLANKYDENKGYKYSNYCLNCGSRKY